VYFYDTLAFLCGTTAAVLLFAVQIPQICLSYARKSPEGLNWLSVVVYTFGVSFHVANGVCQAMPFPLLLTGFLLLAELLVLLVQFALYRRNR